MSIKRSEIRIGAAHAENRVPSHDGEYLAVYYSSCTRHGGDWIIESNAGVVATAYNIGDVIADATDAETMNEICRWRHEAEAIVATGSGDYWDAERMGLEARAAAAELGWL